MSPASLGFSLIFFMPREDIERMIQESGVQIKLDMEEVRELH
jgi:hypothetical protein